MLILRSHSTPVRRAIVRLTLMLVTLALATSIVQVSSPAEAAEETWSTVLAVYDQDFAVSEPAFGEHPDLKLADDGDLANKDRQIIIWVRMQPGACSGDVLFRVVDPAGSTKDVTPFTGCPTNPGLLETTVTMPYSGAGDWELMFSHHADPNAGEAGFSLRAARLEAVEPQEAVVPTVDHPLDSSHPAVSLGSAESFAANNSDAGPAAAVAPTGSQAVGDGHVYRYQSVTEAGGSERSAFVDGLSDGTVDREDEVDVTVVRTDALVEMVLLDRDPATGSEVLSFEVVSGATRSWSRSAANFESFNPGVDVDTVPAQGVSVTDHGDMPPLIIDRDQDGIITKIVRHPDADSVGLEFVESVLNSFHFSIQEGETAFSTDETSRLYEDRRIDATVHGLPDGSGVRIRRIENIPTTDLGQGETRERTSEMVIANDGALAAKRSIDRTEVAASPGLADMDDNRGEALSEAKAAAVTDVRLHGTFVAPVSFLTDRLDYRTSGDVAVDRLDPVTARAQRAVVRAIRDVRLMDDALDAFAAAPTASATVWHLAKAIEAHPDRADEVAQLVGAAETHDGALIAVSALVVAGRDVPQAQEVLASVMNDTDVATARRLTAAVNAVAINNPSSSLVSAAQALTTDPDASQNASSTLAWSALASRSADKSDDATVFAYLTSEAAAAQNADDASIAVAALENLGDQAALQLAYETAKRFNVYTSVKVNDDTAAKLAKIDGECGHRETVETSGYIPGIDWGCSLGTERIRAVLDINMGVTGVQGGPNGGGNFLAEGAIGVNIYERDDNPDDDVDPPIARRFELARAVVSSELDRYDENNLNDHVINVPGSQDVQFGQVEREFRFQVRTIFNSSDTSSDNYWLVNKTAKVTCGLGAAFDLSLREDGEPRLATNWDPWEWPIPVGPFVIEISLHLRGSITFPTQVSLDICNFGLFTSDYYPRDWVEGEEPQRGVVWATLSATVTPTIKLDATVSVAVELLIVKIGVEAEGTLIGLELPIRGSLQLLDVNQANSALDPTQGLEGVINQVQNWGAPDFRIQPCYSISLHLYLLRMRFSAYGEFGVRIPPIPPFIKGGWVTFYRQEWDLGSWEWQPESTGWDLLDDLLAGLPILESNCTTIAPMVPIVTPITQQPVGSYSPPQVGGQRIGLFTGNYDNAPDTLLYPSADQFCIDEGFPGYAAMASTDNTESRTAYWDADQNRWVDRNRDGAEHGRMIATLQCDISSTTTPGSGQIGLCLSADPLDWTLLYTGPYGGYITTSSTGGEFTPFLTSDEASAWTSSEDTERMLQLAWYRVCINDQGTVVTSNSQAPLDKDTMFSYLTSWISGATAYQDCMDLQVTLNLYEPIDCDRFDSNSFPDITVNVTIDDGQLSALTTANISPGPTIASGEVDVIFDVSNTGVFEMDSVTVTGSGDIPATCVAGDLAIGGTATCTATLSTAVDVEGDLVERPGTQGRNVTLSGTYERDGETRDASFSQSFFFTVEADSAPSYDVAVSLVGSGGSFDVTDSVEVPPGDYDLYPSITNTGQTDLQLGYVVISGGGWSDPGGCSGLSIEPGRTVSCTAQSASVQTNTDYTGTVNVSAGNISRDRDFAFVGGSAATGTDLAPGDITISAVMRLSGDDTEYDPNFAPPMDPLLPASAESNGMIFTVANTTADRTIEIAEDDYSFSRNDGGPDAVLVCNVLPAPLGSDSSVVGYAIPAGDSLICSTQLRPAAPGAESLSLFSVTSRAEDNPTRITTTSQNPLKTGVAQLSFTDIEETAGNQLTATVLNSSTYPGTLDGIAVSLADPQSSVLGALNCPTTLASTEDMACTWPISSGMQTGEYTLTATANGTQDTTATWSNSPTDTDIDFDVQLRIHEDRVGESDVVEAGDVVEFAIINRNQDQALDITGFTATRDYWDWDGMRTCAENGGLPASGMTAVVIPPGGTFTCEDTIEPHEFLLDLDVSDPYGTYEVHVTAGGDTESASITWGQRTFIDIGESGSGDGAMHLRGTGLKPTTITVTGRDELAEPISRQIGEEFIEGVDDDWTAVFNVDWFPGGLFFEDFLVEADQGGMPTPVTIQYPQADDTIFYPNVLELEAWEVVSIGSYTPGLGTAGLLSLNYVNLHEITMSRVGVGDIVVVPMSEHFPRGASLKLVESHGQNYFGYWSASMEDLFRQVEHEESVQIIDEQWSYNSRLEDDRWNLPHNLDAQGPVSLTGTWISEVGTDVLIQNWWDPEVVRYDITKTGRLVGDAIIDIKVDGQIDSDILVSDSLQLVEPWEWDKSKFLFSVGPIPVIVDYNRQIEAEISFKFDGDLDARATFERTVVTRSTVDENGDVIAHPPVTSFSLTDESVHYTGGDFEVKAGVEAELLVGIFPFSKLVKGTLGVQGNFVIAGQRQPGNVGQGEFFKEAVIEVGYHFLPGWDPQRFTWVQGWLSPYLDNDTYFAEWQVLKQPIGTFEYGVATDVGAGPHSQGDWTVYFNDTTEHNGGAPNAEYTVGQATLRGDLAYPDRYVVGDDRLDIGVDPVVLLLPDDVLITSTLSDTTVKVWLRLEGGECASDLEVHVRNVAGAAQTLYPFTDCGDPTAQFQIATVDLGTIVNGETVHDDWQVTFTNRNPAAGSLAVEAVRIDYDETLTFDGLITEDTSVYVGGYGAENQGQLIYTGPSTGAVVSNVELDLAIRVDGSSCEDNIEILVVQPNDENRIFESEFSTCDGGIVSTTLFLDNFTMP